MHAKEPFVFVVGPLVLGYIPFNRNTTNQSAPFPTPPPESCLAIHAPFLADAWLAVSFDSSSAILVFGAQVVCPLIVGMLFVVFREEEMKGVAHHPFQTSLRIASTLSASLEMLARPAFRNVSLQGRTR